MSACDHYQASLLRCKYPLSGGKADRQGRWPILRARGPKLAYRRRHADRLVGNVCREVKPDKRHVETAHEAADGEQPEALRLERLLQRVLRSLRDGRAWLCARGTLLPKAE